MEIPARVVYHPGKNGNSRPGGDFSVKSDAKFSLFDKFFRENVSTLLLIRKNRILNQWLGQE